MSTAEAMKERPILFSGAMVRAILEGIKTQTRRIVKPVLGPRADWTPWEGVGWKPNGLMADIPSEAFSKMLYCPYGEVGDYLWVKETFQTGEFACNEPRGFVYRATELDWETCEGWKWKPSIFMPRAASRISLEITGMQIERLQDITGEDCVAEGIPLENHKCGCERCATTSELCTATQSDLVMAYQELWDSINGKGSWAKNPYVWVLEFRRIGA